VQKIEAEYEIVTPLMLGGANHAPEFRLASFVNVVRWWWRFLALGRYGGDAARATFWEAVLFGWSAPPFGRKRVSFRLSRPVQTGFKWDGPAIPNGLRDWSGINYLTAQAFSARSGRTPVDARAFSVAAHVQGFALGPFRELVSGALRANERRWALAELNGEGEDRWQTAVVTLIDALALIGLIGGLGARSRRGFGSLALTRLEIRSDPISEMKSRSLDRPPATVEEYRQRIAGYLGRSPYAGLPPYTALSDRTRISVVARADDASTLMNDVGFALQYYRTWGERTGATHRHRYVENGNQQQIAAGTGKTGYLFTQDHNWYLGLKAYVDAARSDIQATRDDENIGDDYKRHRETGVRRQMEQDISSNAFSMGVPRRIAFGLPHNYLIQPSTPLRGDGRPLRSTVSIEPATSGRRASPLMLHFHPLSSGGFIAVVCFVPAVFLGGAVEVIAKVGQHSTISTSLAAESHLKDFGEVSGFIEFVSGGTWKTSLKGVATQCSCTEIFPKAP